ncbi:MAG: leucyl aminopeptidase family protein, partial [Bradyrhizobium sp.]|nr:leucyl aminopeptidase family protein [Bradyrhizobium sp.]
MPSVFETSPTAIPITFVTKSSWDQVAEGLPAAQRQFAIASAFTAKPGGYLALPALDGAIAQVLFGLEDEGARSRDLFRPGALPGLLPPGVYRFANAPHDARLAALAFALGSYRFARYRKADRPEVRL